MASARGGGLPPPPRDRDLLRPRTWTRGALTAASVLLAGVAYLVGVAGGAAEGARGVVLLVAGAVLAMTAVWFAAEERAQSRAERRDVAEAGLAAETRLQLAVNEAFAPLTAYLAALATSDAGAPRQVLVGQLRQAVVDAAVGLAGTGARATYYRLAPGGGVLRRTAWAGRAETPRERFDAGTPDGDVVLSLVEQGRSVLVRDVGLDPVVVPRSSGYGTIVGVAVLAGVVPLGLLSVDAPRPGDLDDDDLALLRVLGNLLAAGEG